MVENKPDQETIITDFTEEEKKSDLEPHIGKKDIRYVNVEAGFVRDSPDLASSERVNVVNFGDTIVVEEMRKDSIEDIEWLKYTQENNEIAWISDQIVTKLVPMSDEDGFLLKLNNMVPINNLPVILSYLGKIVMSWKILQKLL